MAKQKNMEAVSSKEVTKILKKQTEYTRWVQQLVNKHLGFCPSCGQKMDKDKQELKAD
jgi:hypothetical protein